MTIETARETVSSTIVDELVFYSLSDFYHDFTMHLFSKFILFLKCQLSTSKTLETAPALQNQ